MAGEIAVRVGPGRLQLGLCQKCHKGEPADMSEKPIPEFWLHPPSIQLGYPVVAASHYCDAHMMDHKAILLDKLGQA